MEKIGANIRKLRENKGLSQDEFGKLIGKSGSQVGAYENEKTEMPVSLVYVIAEKFKVDIGWLMTGELREKKKYDVSMRIYNLEDRLRVIQILAKNGYDVGQHKEAKNAKAVDYFVHGIDTGANVDTSRQGGSTLAN